MSIREVRTQAQFAGIAYSHIDPKAANGNDAVFSSIHSFLSHCAMVSKMLSGKYGQTETETIGDILGISNLSPIHDRTLRDNLEHYYNKLKNWISKYGADVMIGDYNIGPKSVIQIPGMVFVRQYDPTTSTFTFVNDDFDLGVLATEVQKIKGIADKLVRG